MTARAIAVLQLMPSHVMALKDLLLEYVVAKEHRAHLEPREEWIDIVNEITTTPEQLLEVVSAVMPRAIPLNTFTSVELDGMLEKLQADERKRIEFEQSRLHVGDSDATVVPRAIAGLDLGAPCHQGAPMTVRYTAAGVLEMRCGLCGQPTANVLVA